MYNRSNKISFIHLLAKASSVKWPTKEQELLDEIHDAEILKAVQHSMYEYEMANRNHRYDTFNYFSYIISIMSYLL